MSGKPFALRLISLLGVALCALSLAESWRDAPLLCPLDGSCEAVTRSAWGRPLGVPLPYWGMAGFGAVYLLSLHPPASRLLGALAILGGGAGMALAAVQAVVLRQYCRLCLLIDGAAMLLAVTELAWPPAEPATPPRLWPWIVALVPAVAGPLAVSRFAFAEPGVPAEVLALQRSGQVTVVFVTDFECKQCRAAHPMLRRLVEEHSPRARLVMFVFPLPAHQHSRDAALAYFAAERMGKGPAMAEALVAADDLSARGCEKLAEKLGLEAGKFREHVSSREAEERLGEAGWLKKAGVPGLPAVWVGTKKFSGALEEEALREAFEAQLAAGGGG